MHFCCFKAFSGKFTVNFSFFVQKVNFSEMSTEILREFVFLNKFEKGKIVRKIGFVYRNVFDQTSKMGEILTKTKFSPQSEPHTAKLCFSVILKHFQGNSQRTSLFSQKRVYLRKQH